MEVLKVVGYLIGGVLVLSWGANFFVQSASHLARRFGISPVIIGLTVVAFGTSAPELTVNVIAAIRGNTDLALGNVVGSNTFNIAFILGICALISPLKVSSQLIKIDIPIMVLVSLFLLWSSYDQTITRAEGMILLSGIVLYTLLQIKLSFKGQNSEDEFKQEYSAKGNLGKDAAFLAGGLVALVVGAHFFVDGAVLGARLLGWSEAVIGLTIIAAGTSLPEVATSVAATLKGERDIAIGNVVGSNLFNILGVVGVSGVLSKTGLPVNDHMVSVDLPVMVLLTFICLPFSLWRKKLERPVGGVLLLSWIVYTVYLIQNAS